MAVGYGLSLGKVQLVQFCFPCKTDLDEVSNGIYAHQGKQLLEAGF